METFLSMIEWGPVLVSTVLAFALGMAWYTMLFQKQWLAGLPQPPVWRAPMWMPMSAQLGSTLLLAIIFNVASSEGHVGHAFLVAITVVGFIKANGMYSGHGRSAIVVDVLYILAMALIMVGVNAVM